MAASESSSCSAAAGLHGGSCVIDLTGDSNDFLGVTRRRRNHGAVMDDGRAYAGRTPLPMSTNNANTQPDQRERDVCSIDLVNNQDDLDAEDDGTTKKRSLRINSRKSTGNNGPHPKSSPMRKKRTIQPLNNDLIFCGALPTSPINLPSRNTDDGATLTFGLLSLIDLLKDENTLTCEGSLCSSNNKLLNPISSSLSSELPFNHQPFHYLQSDNWGCGFRNLQMLISSMMPTLSSVFPEGVPSVEDIQRTMEILWRHGFDLRNAKHHKHSLVGKKTWIGTVEVWSYLSFMRVDSIIIQFIKTKDNRGMLGKFIWAYFNRICGDVGCSCKCHDTTAGKRLASPSVKSSEYAAALLENISKSNRNKQKCNCSLPPLYLQWDGHSVTVVGIQRICSNKEEHPSFKLIIFCPQKNGASIKGILAKEFAIRRTSREKSKTSIINDKFVSSVVELPLTKLREKDCQVLLSTARIIDERESNSRKRCKKYVGFRNAEAPTT
mmetsp:Transcript_3943/g.9991  ORF Transcript_3943/g.9991 Transcript_3943/m.9991 type:complete len:494 (+) Transcript_3943:99-1580(+)